MVPIYPFLASFPGAWQNFFERLGMRLTLSQVDNHVTYMVNYNPNFYILQAVKKWLQGMRPVDTSLVSLSYADTCHCILPYSDPCTLTLQMKEGTALDLGGLVVSSFSSVSTWPGGHLVPHYWCYHYISVSNPITSWYYFITLFSYAKIYVISDWVSILRMVGRMHECASHRCAIVKYRG